MADRSSRWVKEEFKTYTYILRYIALSSGQIFFNKVKSLLSKLTEEKKFVVQQNTRLQQELEQLDCIRSGSPLLSNDTVLLDLKMKHIDEGKHIHDFFVALAACNTIDECGESPDEQALVYVAASYGFMLVERSSGHIIVNIQGETQRKLK